MSNTYVYPTGGELISIAQTLLPQLEVSSEIASMFPVRVSDQPFLLWEQRDPFNQRMKARGLNGPFGRLKPTAITRYSMNPGVYGCSYPIDEAQLTLERREGTWNQPADITTEVMVGLNHTLVSEITLRESLCWTLIATGSFQSTDEKGTVLDTKSFSQRKIAAAVTWATHATATPLADLRAIALLHRGFSVRFGRSAKAYMNQQTANDFMLNSNAADLGGKRRIFGETVNDMKAINLILSDNDLPMIYIYDEGYLDDNGVFQLYIPNNVVIIRGDRTDGATVGEFLMTRNANNPNKAPGQFVRVVDNIDREPPREISVYRGFNGGPVPYYPSAIPVLAV